MGWIDMNDEKHKLPRGLSALICPLEDCEEAIEWFRKQITRFEKEERDA